MIAQTSTSPRLPARHLLAFDLGNQRTKVGIWSRGDIRAADAVPHDDAEGLAALVARFWAAMEESPKAGVACAVVREPLRRLRDIFEAATGEKLLVVGEHVPPPIPTDLADPESVGMDRLCCAAAAHLIEGQACAVVDLGTATTVNCVSDEGRFLGGAILPGLAMQARALAAGTDRLPEVQVAIPAGPIGGTTEQAILSGIAYGSIGAIRELVERFATLLGRWPTLIVTGGGSELLGGAMDFADKIIPHLCLRGVVLAYERAFDPD